MACVSGCKPSNKSTKPCLSATVSGQVGKVSKLQADVQLEATSLPVSTCGIGTAHQDCRLAVEKTVKQGGKYAVHGFS